MKLCVVVLAPKTNIEFVRRQNPMMLIVPFAFSKGGREHHGKVQGRFYVGAGGTCHVSPDSLVAPDSKAS